MTARLCAAMAALLALWAAVRRSDYMTLSEARERMERLLANRGGS